MYVCYMKKCSKCKTEKPLSEFSNSVNGKFGKHHYCKICHYKSKKYDYSKSLKQRLKYKYKMTSDDLNFMYLSQDKKCKICGNEYKNISKFGGLYIDHCHSTGEVRGLLCRNCNSLLGLAKDNVVILKNAIEYLNLYDDTKICKGN